MFYFLDYEGLRAITKPLFVLTLPTQNELNGVLVVPVRNPITCVVYPAGQAIPTSQMNPLSLMILNDFKNISGLPSAGSAANGQNANDYSVLIPFRDFGDKGDLRLDYAPNASSRYFLRVSDRKETGTNFPQFRCRSKVRFPDRNVFSTSRLRWDIPRSSAPIECWTCGWASRGPRRAKRRPA